MDDAELRENLKRLAAWANSQGATIGLHAIEAVHRIDELTRIASRLEADEDDVERVARAICEAEGGQWRERTEKPAVGMPHYYNFDRLNNHWRHKARAAILAMRRAAQEPTP